MSAVKSVFSVEHQQHIRYAETTMAELKVGDVWVAFQSDIGTDYRISVIGSARGKLLCRSTNCGESQTFVPVLDPSEKVIRIFN